MVEKKCPDCPKCLPGWLAAFGDLMSLLLVFFVLLLSMAIFDKPKVEEYFDVMRKSMGILEQSAESIDAANKTGQQTESINDVNEESTTDSEDEISEIKEELSEAVQKANQSAAAMSQSTSKTDQAVFTDGEKEFKVEIPSSMLFEEGMYELNNQDGKDFVKKLSKIIRTMTVEFQIDVIGHTGNESIENEEIPRDNWDLSALRAVAVVTELIKNKTDPTILKLSAFASNVKKSNIDSENRRVELRFITQQEDQIDMQQNNFFGRLNK